MSADEAAVTEDASAKTSSSGKRGWLWISLVALLLATGGAAAAWYAGLIGVDAEQDDASIIAVQSPPIYYTLDSNLVVNFHSPGRARYLQLGIELMTRDPKTVEALDAHAPVIRNNLILLLSDQSYEELSTREGKVSLQAAALAEVQAVLEDHHGSSAVEFLYFTTFVMQ